MEDISPALLEKLQKAFAAKLKSIELRRKTYTGAYEYAERVGAALAETFAENLSAADLPNGKMYWNIANAVVKPLLEQDHALIGIATRTAQEALNQSAGLGLKAQAAPLDTDKVDGILNKLAAADNYDEAAWVLNEPVKTFSRGIVDETLQRNVNFQGKAGLHPTVTRRAEAGCCAWCAKLAGTYSYPDVPKDVYRRHENCECTVTYNPGDGRRQDVHTKQWTNDEESVKIEERKAIGLNQPKLDSLHPASVAGAKLGQPMSFEEADTGKVNPNYGKSTGYAINCQTCVVAFEARQRGYNVQALPNTKGSMLDKLSRKTNLAWLDPETGEHPNYIVENKAFTPKTYKAYLDSVIEPNRRYTLEFAWKGRGNGGHIVNLDRTADGQLRIKDNQRGNGERSEYIGDEAVLRYLSRMKYTRTYYGTKFNSPPKILRIDNMQFDLSVVGQILEEAKP